jgi:predicted small lipoprotein YifL
MTRTSTVLALAAMALSSTMAGCGEQGMMILGCDSLGASRPR